MSTIQQQPAPATIWRNLNFLLLWWGQTVSGVGNRISQLAFPLLVLAVTGSPAQAGLMSALTSVPSIVLLLPAGALLDQWNRKLVMILCDAGRALALGSIPVALATGHLTIVHLALVALTEGVLSTFFGVAAEACLPQVVEQRQIPHALAVTSVTDHVMGFIGPSLGGALFSISRALPMLVDAVSYLVSVVSLMLIKTQFQTERIVRPASLWVEMRFGMRWLWQQPILRFLAFLSGGLNLFSMGYSLIMIVRAQQLHASTADIGLLFATGGIGGIIGATITPWLQRRYGVGTIMIVASWIWVLTWPPYAFAPNLIWLGATNIVGWLIIPVHSVTLSGYRLAVVPDQLRGRVNSAYKLIAYGSQPISLAMTGFLLQYYDVTGTVLLITIPQAILALLATLHTRLRAVPKLADLTAGYEASPTGQ